jgi:ArsR family transcriptional regulator
MKTTAAKATTKLPAMTDEQFRAISRVLADPRRFAILEQVAGAPGEGLACGALHEHTEISPATISHHLKELAEAGLVEVHRDGRCANLSLERSVWASYVKRLSAL